MFNAITNADLIDKINRKKSSNDYSESDELFGLYFTSFVMPLFQLLMIGGVLLLVNPNDSIIHFLISFLALLALCTLGFILDLIGICNSTYILINVKLLNGVLPFTLNLLCIVIKIKLFVGLISGTGEVL